MIGAAIAVPQSAQAIAVGAGGAWVVSGTTISHIDASTGKLISSGTTAGADPDAIAVGFGDVWVAGFHGTVSRFGM